MESIVFILVAILIIYSLFVVKTDKKYKDIKRRFDFFKIKDVEDAKKRLDDLQEEYEELKGQKNKTLNNLDTQISIKQDLLKELESQASENENKIKDADKRLENLKNRFLKSRDLYTAMDEAIKQYYNVSTSEWRPLNEENKTDLDNVYPTVMLTLNCMNYKDLRKQFLNNQKQVNELLEQFKERYTTKSNKAIYQLMATALMSEIQNILIALKYGNLEEKLQDVRILVAKFIAIAEEGNQTISNTVKKFAYALQNLFENSVRIEYEYYIKKEQARQEQLELKARMKEEREEQRRLAEQAEHFAKEQEKYLQEKDRLQSKLDTATDSERDTIKSAIEKLDEQLQNIEHQKDEIAKLQHGKAGNVYIISNIGSFGDDVFKQYEVTSHLQDRGFSNTMV